MLISRFAALFAEVRGWLPGSTIIEPERSKTIMTSSGRRSATGSPLPVTCSAISASWQPGNAVACLAVCRFGGTAAAGIASSRIASGRAAAACPMRRFDET